MNCATCKVNKIGPKTPPFGGYLCGKEHLQCFACNRKSKGKCGICKNGTNFVQMNFNPTSNNNIANDQLQMADAAVNQPPTAPSLHLLDDSSPFLTKTLFSEIETLSSISQEHLTMPDSHESLPVPEETDELQQRDTEREKVKPMVKSQRSYTKTTCDSTVDSDEGNKLTAKFAETFLPQESISNYKYTNPQKAYGKTVEKTSEKQQFTPSKSSSMKDNAFLFDDDPNDSNIINTSEIRFMDSTDSLKNLYSNNTTQCTSILGVDRVMDDSTLSTNNDPIISNNNQQQQPDGLSVKMVKDFENLNPSHGSELVEHYLRTYGPMPLHYFPTHNCQQTECDLNWTVPISPVQFSTNGTLVSNLTAMKSICVSTESDPSLKNARASSPPEIEVNPPTKYKPNDYLVMPAVGVTKPEATSIAYAADKLDGVGSLDIRMQKILETLREEPRVQKVHKEKPEPGVPKGNIIKIPTNLNVGVTEKVSVLTEKEKVRKNDMLQKSGQINLNQSNAVALKYLINTHRAYYNPPRAKRSFPVNGLNRMAGTAASIGQELPLAQYETVTCPVSAAQELLTKKARYLNMKPWPAYYLNIPRTPIQCPESNCQRTTFVSDFNKHLVMDHNHLPMERITPFQHKSFFLDPRLSHCGTSKCHLLYLMKDKVTNLGSSKYKDFLPLLVMSSRINLADMCLLNHRIEKSHSDFIEACKATEFVLIWITGIIPEEFPISVSLTIWTNTGVVPRCHLVHSGEVYSIRNSQQGIDVWQSGHVLLLSALQVDFLTKGGTEMLNLQLVVH